MKGIRVKTSIGIVIMLTIICLVEVSWKRDVKSLVPVEYVKWMQDPKNGLMLEKKFKEVGFKLQYKPVAYMVVNIFKDPYLQTKVYNGQVGKYSELEYYKLSIVNSTGGEDVLMKGIDNKNDYYQREGYYSYDFAKDIILVRNNDTVPCTICNYTPNYGLSPHIDFEIAFVKDKNEKDKALYDRQIIIDDQVFDNGMIKFQLKKDDINNQPSLITY